MPHVKSVEFAVAIVAFLASVLGQRSAKIHSMKSQLVRFRCLARAQFPSYRLQTAAE